jgi:hypothetical protein
MLTYTFYYGNGSVKVLKVARPLEQVVIERPGRKPIVVNVLQQLNELFGTSLTQIFHPKRVEVSEKERAIEKQKIKTAIHAHKNLKKNPVVYKEKRDELISTILASRTPNWGSVRMSF